MGRFRLTSLLLRSLAGGLVVVAVFRLLAHFDARAAGVHGAGGLDRIGEAQLFVLIALVSMVLLMVAVIGALEREHAAASGSDAEEHGEKLTPSSGGPP